MSKPDEVRLDSQGRDVTHLPGLWSEDDKIIKGEPMSKTDAGRDFASSDRSSSCGMTEAEIAAMQHLVDFWNAYVMLPETQGVIETTEVRHAVHTIQGALAIRVARRANPEIWR